MKNLIDILEEHAENHPSKIAIISENNKITYGELSVLSSKFANSLTSISKKSVVSLVFENSINFVISYLGTLKAGHIAHIISPYLLEKNFKLQIESASPKLLIIDENNLTRIKNYALNLDIRNFDSMLSETSLKCAHEAFHTDIAHLLYTSGTTSEPKGIPITHSNLVFTIKNIVTVLEYNFSDVILLPLPLNHSFGLGCLNTSLYVGGQVILLKDASNLPLIIESIKKFNATTLAAVPTTLIKLLKAHKIEIQKEFNSLRLIMTNSTSIPPETVIEFEKILSNGMISTYYGLTEASRSTFMIFKALLNKETSVGKPAPGVEIQIRNKKNNIGEIWIKGPNVINHYWKNPLADKNLNDGWLKSGDLGYFDDEGFLFLVGREDDVINVGGEKIYPEYVENIIKNMHGIEQVAVIGINHQVFGQTVKALVKLNQNSKLKKSDILLFCIKNLEKFMVPSKIEFVDDIPQTEYGKIKRVLLKTGERTND